MTLKINKLSARISSMISLQDIDMKVDSGSVSIVIGPNGSGKTSLMRAVCGDLQVESGSVEFNNRQMPQWGAKERATMLAILPQNSSLEFPFTVQEVVAMGRTPHATSHGENQRIARKALELVDCEKLEKRSFVSLSGGEKQRVQLARVAAQIWNPVPTGNRCLILDEPTASLDLAHQEMVALMLRFFADQGVAVLAVLHDLNLAAKCADQIAVLKQGRCIVQGAPEQVLREKVLEDVFSTSVSVIGNPRTGKPMIVT
ncbi:MAG: heme ABC transporter ATP-binding protein [Pseudohongiellaceae bacterium]